MKATQRYFLLVGLTIIFSSLVLAQMSGPQITKASMQNDGTVLINWAFDLDNSVEHYEIYRSTDVNGPFNQIGNAPKGTLYFIDKNDLFKTVDKLFYYKVKAVMGAGYSQTSSSMSVFYSIASSTPKRTWGSIKAMFR
jgi:fibronectin type 3 domain-containing protein